MPETSVNRSEPLTKHQQSSRAVGEVGEGEDSARELFEASSIGDISMLQRSFLHPHGIKIALERPYRIVYEQRPLNDANDERAVQSQRQLNLYLAVMKAAETNQAEAVTVLLKFAVEQDVDLSQFIGYPLMSLVVKEQHEATFKALAAIYPEIVTYKMSHLGRPLDIASFSRYHSMVELIFELGAGFKFSDLTTKLGKTNHQTLVGNAVLSRPNPRMLQRLLEHGAPVSGIAALHFAASMGCLESMGCLIEHGADVNELYSDLTKEQPPKWASWRATWTPMHSAADAGKVDAMELLSSHGGRSDVMDERGMTPAHLLEEWKKKQASADDGVLND